MPTAKATPIRAGGGAKVEWIICRRNCIGRRINADQRSKHPPNPRHLLYHWGLFCRKLNDPGAKLTGAMSCL